MVGDPRARAEQAILAKLARQQQEQQQLKHMRKLPRNVRVYRFDDERERQQRAWDEEDRDNLRKRRKRRTANRNTDIEGFNRGNGTLGGWWYGVRVIWRTTPDYVTGFFERVGAIPRAWRLRSGEGLAYLGVLCKEPDKSHPDWKKHKLWSAVGASLAGAAILLTSIVPAAQSFEALGRYRAEHAVWNTKFANAIRITKENKHAAQVQADLRRLEWLSKNDRRYSDKTDMALAINALFSVARLAYPGDKAEQKEFIEEQVRIMAVESQMRLQASHNKDGDVAGVTQYGRKSIETGLIYVSMHVNGNRELRQAASRLFRNLNTGAKKGNQASFDKDTRTSRELVNIGGDRVALGAAASFIARVGVRAEFDSRMRRYEKSGKTFTREEKLILWGLGNQQGPERMFGSPKYLSWLDYYVADREDKLNYASHCQALINDGSFDDNWHLYGIKKSGKLVFWRPVDVLRNYNRLSNPMLRDKGLAETVLALHERGVHEIVYRNGHLVGKDSEGYFIELQAVPYLGEEPKNRAGGYAAKIETDIPLLARELNGPRRGIYQALASGGETVGKVFYLHRPVEADPNAHIASAATP